MTEKKKKKSTNQQQKPNPMWYMQKVITDKPPLTRAVHKACPLMGQYLQVRVSSLDRTLMLITG